jgi:hypothetical protein
MHKKNTKRGTFTMRDIILRLAKHLQDLIMGYPYNELIPTGALAAVHVPFPVRPR